MVLLLTGMNTDKTLSAADQPAGSVLGHVGVGELSLATLAVETHFRYKRFGPLLSSGTVNQRHIRVPTSGLRLEVKKD